MESQMHRPTEQERPQHVASDTEMVESQADQGEKKSVLKKVKDKAKKIKDTIKKHGLGQGDDADDQETNTNLAVHGAPAREHPVITGTNLPLQTGFNLEKPSDTREDRYDDVKGKEYTSLREKGVASPPQAMETEFETPTPETHEPEIKNMTEPDVIDVSQVHVPQPAVKPATTLDMLEEDRQEDISPTNHQTKVVDPTGQGGKEAEVGSLIQGLKNVAVVSDESKSSAQREQTQSGESKSLPEQEQSPSYTGSHDQFALQSTPTEESFIPQSHPMPADEPKSYDPNRPESMPRDTITGKIPSAIVDEAASAKNAVASKLGDDNTQKKPLSESAAEYKNMVLEKLAPVYEKVSGAGTTVMSKVRGSGTGEQQQGGGGGGDEASKGPNKGVSVRDYLSEKFKPGDEDKALSEAISQKLQVKKKSLDENEARDKSKTDVSSPGVMGSLKGVVGSWLGKSSGAESAAAADDQSQSHGSEETAAQDEANVEQKMKQ